MKERGKEKIGAGFFVFRRGKRTNRIKTGSIMAGKIPFEHPSLESAIEEAKRLSKIEKSRFSVFKEVHVEEVLE